MAGLTTTDFADAMKTLYIGPLNDQVFRSHVLLNRIQKNSKDVSGNFAYIPLISARNPAIGSRKDSGSVSGPKLPEAGRQSYTKFTFTMGMHYGRGQISGAVKRKSKSDAGAFAKALQIEMEGLMESMPDDLNRQVCGDGTGRAGTITATVANSTTLIVVSATSNFQAKVGDRVHFAHINTGAILGLANGAQITAIDYYTDAAGAASTTAHRVTIDTSTASALTFTGAADNYQLYFGAGTSMTTEDSSRGQEIYGIQALVDSGDIGARNQTVADNGEILAGPGDTGDKTKIGGIVRSSNAFLKSIVKTNPAGAGTQRPLTTTIMQEAWLTATAHNGAQPQDIEGYMDPAMWGTLGMLQVGGRIYNDFQETVEEGFTAIKFNGSKMLFDRDMPRNAIFFLHMKDLMLLTQTGYEFIDDDGTTLRMVAGGNRDAWEFSIVRDMQLAYRRGRTHVQLRDIKNVMTVEGQLR